MTPSVVTSASSPQRARQHLSAPSLGLVVCALLTLGAAGAALLNSYYLLLMTFAAVYMVAAMGLNLLTGYAGIVSIAHGALVCVGTYATAIASVRYGWGFWPSAVLAALVGMAFSAVLGLPALRLSSWYFVLITIAFTLAVTAMLNDLRSFTGGYGGIVGIPKPSVAGFKLDGFGLFVLIAGAGAMLWWVMHNLLNSRIGWALQSIREGDVRARSRCRVRSRGSPVPSTRRPRVSSRPRISASTSRSSSCSSSCSAGRRACRGPCSAWRRSTCCPRCWAA